MRVGLLFEAGRHRILPPFDGAGFAAAAATACDAQPEQHGSNREPADRKRGLVGELFGSPTSQSIIASRSAIATAWVRVSASSFVRM
jgi:hypothetical protein